ncbi:MAG: ABC transporter ATP-binding protein/permease [Treponema sp.]|nr:ABC transporter ATP-binding protein/permease [Treponema sp.]
MADFFASEEVVKSYDSKITLRILACLKPYKPLIAFTLIALVFTTLGELAVPLLQQRVIDDAIVVRFHVINTRMPRVNLSDESSSTLSFFDDYDNSIRAGDFLFIPLGAHRMSSATETELEAAGILDKRDWYAFRYESGSPAEEIVRARPGIFISRLGEAAVLRSDLYRLPVSEIAAIRAADITFIIRTVIILIIILCIVFFFTFVQTYSTTLIGQKVMKDIRLDLFTKTQSQSSAFLSKHPVGRIVTRLTGDVETINEFFSQVLVSFIKDVSVMIGVLITLFILSPTLAFASLLTLPPVLVITGISRIKARDAFRKQRTASARVNSYLSERLAGIQVVQLFGGEKKSEREFAERNEELLKARLGEMYVFASFRPLVQWFSVLTTGIILVVGGNMILNLNLSLGTMIAFINLVGMFYDPLMNIAEKYTLLQSAMAGGERVWQLMDTDERIPDNGTRSLESGLPLRGHIQFDNVHFSYIQGEEVLKGLTFNVNPGEMAAIVGYTGAGKTTIINVLTRLWDIDSGDIRLDGVGIKDITLPELRRNCLPVLQDVFLFSGTVSENISLGLPLTKEQVEEAAKAVHAHEFITRLENGYDTILSEGATNISSGQRQLISFARVIAHDPSVVILDEATSSVDTETERLIQLGIQKVLSGRTSIVIAHRLSTIRHADRILVLTGGQLVEEGKHEELIAKEGLYAGLYKLQYAEEQY